MLCLSDDPSTTPEGGAVRAIFSARASVAGILAFEAALARVQARRGLIPQAAAEDMQAKTDLRFFPEDEWARQREQVGHPLVAILETWRAQLAPDSREWLHYGATTADVFNTVLIQQLQAAGAQLVAQMRGIEQRLAGIAAEHRATPVVARTLGRHALPFTFGMKVATWLAEHGRSIERLEGWLARYRTGILSGAVGTYAAFGDAGPAIEREVMAELDLEAPEAVDWKGSRDRFAEFGCAVALAAATAGHVGQEIFLLCGDDLDELREATGAVGSSTMPHKSNPSLSIEVVSRSREVGARLQPLFAWIGVVHERDSAQHGEVLRDLCVGMADLLAMLQRLLDVLVVMPQNMVANLARSRGLVLSEAITFALAARLGKHSAHENMKRLTHVAQSQGCSLREAALADPKLAPLLAEMPGLFDAQSHLGQAVAITDAAVATVRGRTAPPAS